MLRKIFSAKYFSKNIFRKIIPKTFSLFINIPYLIPQPQVSLKDVQQKAYHSLDKGLTDGSVKKEMSKEDKVRPWI